MYSIGDHLVYGSMGVCTVTDICSVDIPGAAKECYLLIPKYVPNSKVYAPVENNTVETRPLLTREEAESLIESIPEIEAFPIGKEKQQLYESYREAIKSTDSRMLTKLLKTIYLRRSILKSDKKPIPFAEKEFYDKAEMILFGEIASVLEMPLEQVESYITAQIESH